MTVTMTTYQHPCKIVTKQSHVHPSFWLSQHIPPAPMKVRSQTGLMDDFGTLVPLNFYAFAVHLNS